MRAGRRLAAVALGGAGLVVLFFLGWAGYAGVSWLRYGHPDTRADTLLDRFMPVYEVAERHEIVMHAPPGVALAAGRNLDFQQSPVIRAIFRGREWLMRVQPVADTLPRGLLAETQRLGWRILVDDPGRRLVVGAVTQPWESQVVFRGLAPEHYAAFDSAGYAKIIWTMEVDSLGPALTRLRTITRVHTTDATSARRFRRYWSITSPGIRLIRWQGLRVARRAAETPP